MPATLGMVITRPYSPRLISRSPSRISRPMFRLDLAIFNLLSNLPKNMGRDIFSYIFGIHRQHPHHSLSDFGVVDYAIPASLSASRCAPSCLADATRTRNDVACLGIL